MTEVPWLTIIGLGEDGPEGLTSSSIDAINAAEIVMGPERHLALMSKLQAKTVSWPVRFAEGVDQLLPYRGRLTVVLVSGDPFWFGAGSVLARHLDASEWRALPGVSCFSLAAARLGWALEQTTCLGLHAAPLTRLRPHLAQGVRLIVTLRDGKGPAELGAYLASQGFGQSCVHILQSLAGPSETVTMHHAADLTEKISFTHPLCAAIEVQGTGASMAHASGIPDGWFEHDGQITKRPVRALTLSALAPRPGEHLWDIGGGSGSIAIEWLLAHPLTQATTIEANPDRAARIEKNAARLGVDRLAVVTGKAPAVLQGLSKPDAVFIGGGLSWGMLCQLSSLAKGARLVANAVTLESEALLSRAHAELGGELTRITLSEASELGTRRGWKAAYPIVQWNVTLREMERDAVIVAGFGFRGSATPESLRDALARTGMQAHISDIATVADKADTPAFNLFSENLGLPVHRVPQTDLAQAETETDSHVVHAHRNTGSVAEAAALIAAGPGARLLGPRVVSQDQMATCAIACATVQGGSS